MVYLQAASAIHKTGIYSGSKGHVPWDKDQTPLQVRREQVYSEPHTGFGKLNAPDKMAFCASAVLFGGFSGYDGDTTGISLGNRAGSYSTDMRFMESLAEGFPRPGYFSATLPSSPVAEIAILFRLKGPDRITADTAHAGFWALDNALRILLFHKAEAMIVILAHGVEPRDRERSLMIPEDEAYGFAVFLTRSRAAMGLNYTLVLEKSPEPAHNNSHETDEESYFLTMVKAVMNTAEFHQPYIVNGTCFDLTLTKET